MIAALAVRRIQFCGRRLLSRELRIRSLETVVPRLWGFVSWPDMGKRLAFLLTMLSTPNFGVRQPVWEWALLP